MALKDQPVEIGSWKGLWSRGEVPPADHMSVCDNSMFHGDIIYPRPAFEQVRTLGLVPLRAVPFKRSTNPVQSRWIVLFRSAVGTSNELHDVTVGAPSTLIMNLLGPIAQTSDMTVLTAFDRAYISLHNRVNAAQFIPMILWDPDLMGVGGGRFAGGNIPAGTFTVAVSATNGNVEPGKHILAVAYETDTGFVTPPGLFVSVTAPSGTKKCIDLSVIPIGPVGTLARWILMSRVILNDDGNLQNPELFFALRIADNTTTVLNGTAGINLYDSQLQTSAEYLKNIYENPPAGVAMTLYANRVINGNINVPGPILPGLPTLPPKAERSLLIASNPGEPETFSKLDGFRQVTKSEGGGIKNLSEVQGVMYARKTFMTFALQDNGDSFNNWPINFLDSAGGCEPFGVGTFPGTSTGTTKGMQVVLDRSGLYKFDGAMAERPLTWKVEDVFRTLDPAFFAEGMVGVDPERNRLAILMTPTIDPVTKLPVYSNYNLILMGDFQQGLDPDNIRWSLWSAIGGSNKCVGLFFDYRESLIPSLTAFMSSVLGGVDGVYALPDDLSNGISRTQAEWECVVQPHQWGGLGAVQSIRARIARVASTGGTLELALHNVPSPTIDPNAIFRTLDVSASPQGFNQFTNQHKNFNRDHLEMAYIRLRTNSSVALSKLWVWTTPSSDEKLA